MARIAIIGVGLDATTIADTTAMFMERGHAVNVVNTQEEAKNLMPEPKFPIRNIEITRLEAKPLFYPSGQQNRRERRKQQRKP